MSPFQTSKNQWISYLTNSPDFSRHEKLFENTTGSPHPKSDTCSSVFFHSRAADFEILFVNGPGHAESKISCCCWAALLTVGPSCWSRSVPTLRDLKTTKLQVSKRVQQKWVRKSRQLVEFCQAVKISLREDVAEFVSFCPDTLLTLSR